MNMTTQPNPEYIAASALRGGKVDKVCWKEAMRLARVATNDVESFLSAVKQFKGPVPRREANRVSPGLFGPEKRAWDAVRNRYWSLRVESARPKEFNRFNQKWTELTEGRPPIGPDGLWMELEHDVERATDLRYTFEADNIFEAFNRVHT